MRLLFLAHQKFVERVTNLSLCGAPGHDNDVSNALISLFELTAFCYDKVFRLHVYSPFFRAEIEEFGLNIIKRFENTKREVTADKGDAFYLLRREFWPLIEIKSLSIALKPGCMAGKNYVLVFALLLQLA